MVSNDFILREEQRGVSEHAVQMKEGRGDHRGRSRDQPYSKLDRQRPPPSSSDRTAEARYLRELDEQRFLEEQLQERERERERESERKQQEHVDSTKANVNELAKVSEPDPEELKQLFGICGGFDSTSGKAPREKATTLSGAHVVKKPQFQKMVFKEKQGRQPRTGTPKQ
eukprot:ANDGO_07178.mRNA.1 hypothetical protein